jgi:hypothetical protein
VRERETSGAMKTTNVVFAPRSMGGDVVESASARSGFRGKCAAPHFTSLSSAICDARQFPPFSNDTAVL